MKILSNVILVSLLTLVSGKAGAWAMYDLIYRFPGWVEAVSLVEVLWSDPQMNAEASVQLELEGTRIDASENYCIRTNWPRSMLCLARVIDLDPVSGCVYCVCAQGIIWSPLHSAGNECAKCRVYVDTCGPGTGRACP